MTKQNSSGRLLTMFHAVTIAASDELGVNLTVKAYHCWSLSDFQLHALSTVSWCREIQHHARLVNADHPDDVTLIHWSSPYRKALLHHVPKNETRVIFNILYVVSLLQWNVARDILMTLAIKRIHNLPPHLSYVSTLPDITQNRKVMSSSSQ